MQETVGRTSNLSYALERLRSGIGFSFEFAIGDATHNVELTMPGASLTTGGLTETRRECQCTLLWMRRQVRNQCVKRPSRIAH